MGKTGIASPNISRLFIFLQEASNHKGMLAIIFLLMGVFPVY